jgi:pilus assembly protein FimV
MMALSMPGAANALGLGDIHVDSGLNEPLAAEIDIIGATAAELTDLRVAVANRETFLHYGADRPGFLSSATFKVARDSHGRPVLAVRSTESFTEPLVNFLVDLRWNNGEMIRQYTLLLDPPGLATPVPVASSVPATTSVPAAPVATTTVVPATALPAATLPAAAPVTEIKTRAVSRQVDPPRDQPDSARDQGAGRKTTHIKVGAKATLRGIAWRVGERSESDLQRMMIAIFRANPNAFEGNINRIRRGAVLTIPPRTELAAISKTDATREVQTQMAAWRAHARAPAAGDTASANAAASAVMAASPNAATAPSSSAAASGRTAASDTPTDAALDAQVRSMEQELSEMKGLMQKEGEELLRLQHQAVPAADPLPAAQPLQAAEAQQTGPQSGHSVLVPITAGLGALAAALAGLYFRFRRRAPAMGAKYGVVATAQTATVGGMERQSDLVREANQQSIQVSEQLELPDEMPAGAKADAADDTAEVFVDVDDATHPLLPILTSATMATSVTMAARSQIATASSNAAVHEPTVNMHVDTVNLRAEPTRLDYNLLDLDLTAQHVQMPSVLNEHAVIKERRTNLADVLKLAIEREPDRQDLRMKLLELYYSAAATNRRAFLEVVQKLARDRDHLQGGEWDKIAYMGRQIAAENPLFAEESASDDLADCA